MRKSPQQKKRRARFLWAWSIALTLFSLPGLVATIYDAVTQSEIWMGALLMGSFRAVLLLLGIGLGFLARKASREADQLDITEDMERHVLRMAKINGGETSAAMLALETTLNLDQAALVLAEFEKRGHAYSAVVGEGSRRYIFPDLQASGLIARAQSAAADDFMRRLAETDVIDEMVCQEYEG